MESPVGLYKSELIDQHPTFIGRAELERETASWESLDAALSSDNYLAGSSQSSATVTKRPLARTDAAPSNTQFANRMSSHAQNGHEDETARHGQH